MRDELWHDIGLRPCIDKLNAMKKVYLLTAIALITHLSFGAELFVRVTRTGSHITTAYNQTQTNSTNIFRYYDLPGGNINIQVTDQQNGYSIYTGFLTIAQNQRVVAEVDAFGNFKIIQIIQIVTSNWYTTTNGTVISGPTSNNEAAIPANDAGFIQFLKLLDNEAFDSEKLELGNNYVDKTHLSAQQITDIAKKFTFDSNRLEWTKHAYSNCYDKANYFLLKSTFTFSSNYSALEEFIKGQ